MNYPEELREKFNECMYDERDIINKFLHDTADLSSGNQMYEYTLEPMPQLLGSNGEIYKVREICLDPEWFVNFMVKKKEGGLAVFHCHDFAYGELSKIIEMLPNADEIVRKNAISDISALFNTIGVKNIVWMTGEKHIIGDGFDVILVSKTDCGIEVHLRKGGTNYNPTILDSLAPKAIVQLRDHIRTDILKKSEQYKKLKEIILKNKGGAYNFCENNTFLAVSVTPDGTDMQLPVCDVSFENGQLNILVAINGTRLGDETGNEEINLVEKDLTPANLDAIIKFFEEEVYSDIIDTRNAHNPELVRKINAAWKSPKYHDRFGNILFALGCRDKQEIQDKFDIVIDCNETAMDNAHEIMEGVCDDWDLETILSFIRYEE